MVMAAHARAWTGQFSRRVDSPVDVHLYALLAKVSNLAHFLVAYNKLCKLSKRKLKLDDVYVKLFVDTHRLDD